MNDSRGRPFWDKSKTPEELLAEYRRAYPDMHRAYLAARDLVRYPLPRGAVVGRWSSSKPFGSYGGCQLPKEPTKKG